MQKIDNDPAVQMKLWLEDQDIAMMDDLGDLDQTLIRTDKLVHEI